MKEQEEKQQQQQQEQEEELQIIKPNVYIGTLKATESKKTLNKKNIKNIISVMKHSYHHQKEEDVKFNYLSVPIDDTHQTNIIEWFDIVSNWIQSKLDEDNGGVLVHCLAGISRSATILAAYLMKTHRLTADEAIQFISSKRPQIEPNEFFIHQLEMYERCNFQWNPVLYQEQRRFIMGFMADEMKDGAGPEKLLLAYYPSPTPSPKDGSKNLMLTPIKTESVDEKLKCPSSLKSPTSFSFTSKNDSTKVKIEKIEPIRKRLTPKRNNNLNELNKNLKIKLPIETLGNRSSTGEINNNNNNNNNKKGIKLSCKMCRRDLVSFDHILFHSPGKGQSAFAPQKQDMKLFRKKNLILIPNNIITTNTTTNQSSQFNSENLNFNQNNLDVLKKLRVSIPPQFQKIPSNNSSTTLSQNQKDEEDIDHNNNKIISPSSSSSSSSTTTTSTSIKNKNCTNLLKEVSINKETFLDSSSFSNNNLINNKLNENFSCSSYFVEPLSWMKFFLENGELIGKIICPNLSCKSKLGSFDWTGSQCSCGAWVTPGFQILKSKVDEL